MTLRSSASTSTSDPKVSARHLSLIDRARNPHVEENALLLRLKELESIERLVEKVGRIDLHAGEGQGFDALLTKLVRLNASESA